MKKKPLSYAFLQPALQDFLQDKMSLVDDNFRLTAGFDEPSIEERCHDLIQQGVITQDEFEHWIRPAKSLPLEKLTLIASLQSEYSNGRQGPPVQFSAVPQPTPKVISALQWVVLHVDLLNLPDLNSVQLYNEVLSKNHISPLCEFNYPVHQCYWCGDYDVDEMKFSRKHQRYCHAPDCDNIQLSNPDAHPNCCAGQWGLIRRAFKEKIRYYQKSSNKQKDFETKVISAFQKYMDARYEQNNTLENPIMGPMEHGMTKTLAKVSEFIHSPKVKAGLEGWARKIRSYFESYMN